jgi:hypothetical protein
VLAERTEAIAEVGGPHAADSAMGFYDAVMDRKVRVLPHSDLTAAVDGAVKQSKGDRWMWSRKASLVDVSPVVAASIAFRGSTGDTPKQGFAFVSGG